MWWADHPVAKHLWAVDDYQQAHAVEVDRNAGTARHVCRPELLVDIGCTGDEEVVPYTAPDNNSTQGELRIPIKEEPSLAGRDGPEPPTHHDWKDSSVTRIPGDQPREGDEPQMDPEEGRPAYEPDDEDEVSDDAYEPIIDGYTSFDGLEEDDDDDYSSLDGEPVITRIRVIDGKVSQYSRVRPGPEWNRAAYVIEPEGKDGKEMHLVTAEMQKAAELQEHLKRVRLHLMVDRFGHPSIYVVKGPTGNELADRWSKSRRNMVRRMKEDWIKFSGDRTVSEYRPVYARVEIGEPKWPNMTMEEVIALAFKAENRIVDRISHPAVGLL